MDAGDIELAELSSQLAAPNAGAAYLRALLRRTDDGWELHHVSVLIGPEPPRWAEETWEYQGLMLVACQVPAAALAPLFEEADDRTMAFGDVQALVPAALGPAHWRHEPSFARLDRIPLPWPTTSYAIARQEHPSLPSSLLTAMECPSFPDPNTAWRAFAEDNFSLTGAPAPPHDLAVIRVTETNARIGRVHVTPTELTVEIHGDGIAGCELELSGATDRTRRALHAAGRITLPLPHGLPDDAWLWLKGDHGWVDFRPLDPRLGWTGDLAQAGVEIELPVDPQTSVEAVIAGGEGPTVEFKSQLVERRKLKTVAAFATGDGGTIIFGVDRDETTITGLGSDDPTTLRDQLGHLIRAAITPMPEFQVNPYTIDGKTVLVLQVQPGQSPPYGVISSSDAREKPEYFVRRGASTYPAQPGELREAVLRR